MIKDQDQKALLEYYKIIEQAKLAISAAQMSQKLLDENPVDPRLLELAESALETAKSARRALKMLQQKFKAKPVLDN